MKNKKCYYVYATGCPYGYSIVETSIKNAKRWMYDRLMEEHDVEYIDIRVRVVPVVVDILPVGYIFGDGGAFGELNERNALTDEEAMTIAVAIGAYDYCKDDGICLKCGKDLTNRLGPLYHVDKFPYAICGECKN